MQTSIETTTELPGRAVDWREESLPSTWADSFELYHPRGVLLMLQGMWRSFLEQGRTLDLPAQLQGRDRLPAYLLKEFHGMPNGYYSENLAVNYARGFERVMLGKMVGARARIAQRLAGAARVLDLGCGAGRLAAEFKRGGATQVWGIDPCPYALKLAAKEVAGVGFIQALAENTGFGDGSLDGVGVCFVFHELPGEIADRSLDELRRILVPGGRVAITEPSPLHLTSSVLRLLAGGHFLGPYFKALARMVYEPYLRDWLAREPRAWFDRHGFDLVSDEIGVPFRELVAVRR